MLIEHLAKSLGHRRRSWRHRLGQWRAALNPAQILSAQPDRVERSEIETRELVLEVIHRNRGDGDPLKAAAEVFQASGKNDYRLAAAATEQGR